MRRNEPVLGELASLPGYMGEAIGHDSLTVRVCAYCLGSTATTARAVALGWQVTHGCCVPCYNVQIRAITGESAD